MSIAALLGVDDLAGPLLSAARSAWTRWIDDDLELGVVDDLADLPRWLVKATPADRDRPMARLAALAPTDDGAAVALAWLLVPGAKRLAARLAGIAGDADGLIAGQLWVEIRTGDAPNRYVATTILRNVEKASKAEHGIGGAGERADKTWTLTSVTGTVDDGVVEEAEPEPRENDKVLRVVVGDMLNRGLISYIDASCVASATDMAHQLGKPLRGRSGVTSPDAIEHLATWSRTPLRTFRRHMGKLLDQIAAHARTLDVAGLIEEIDDTFTFTEFLMIWKDPAMADRIRKTHQWNEVIVRCQELSWDLDADRCSCPATGQACAFAACVA